MKFTKPMSLKKITKYATLILVLPLIITACGDDDQASAETFNTQVAITDAPTDNTNVSGVFVTLADVQIEGQSIEGFNRTTIDLMQFQNGNVSTLGNLDLESRSYSDINLILDFDTDVNGNAPGSYVLTDDGVRHALEASSNTIQVNDAFEVAQNNANEIVIDFDLRKTIISSASGGADQFDFVSQAELSQGLRLVNSINTGEINGTVTDAQNTSDRIVVYAYNQGAFDAEVETNGQGQSNVQFANAVTSAIVDANGSYELNFLNEGVYELHFASFNDTNGSLEFNSMLDAESTASLNLLGLSVTSNLQLSVNVLITGEIQ